MSKALQEQEFIREQIIIKEQPAWGLDSQSM
jgi:hypothetical protein